jgi:predicted Zn-dependent peptidase
MIETLTLHPGVTLRCYRDSRFKQSCLSIQLVRPMCRQEAAQNALLPAVLLRGCRLYPNLRAITHRLDDLYGASVSALVRRIGDYQTTGLYCAFMEDRFALDGDRILAPMMELLGQLLLDPVTEDGGFSGDFIQSEKKNLISTIESELNDKRAYAAGQLMRHMCREDSFGVPRLGDKESVEAITPTSLYAHYRQILRESPVELFYVGSAEPETVAGLLRPLFAGGQRLPLPPQTAFHPCEGSHRSEEMEITQAKLCLGFTTPITNQTPEFAAMQVFNVLYGAGMTSKLFMNVREKLSLCYAIGSGYYGSKGILTVSAGIDTDKEALTRKEIFAQLEACRTGDFTVQELDAAKEAILSSIRSVHDSPGAIESYYSTSTLSGNRFSLQDYRAAVEQTTALQVAEAARSLQLHSSFILKVVTA